MSASQTRFLPLTDSADYALSISMLFMFCLMLTGMAQAADESNPIPRDTIFYSVPPSADDIGQHLFAATENETLTRSITFKESQEQAAPEKSVSMPVLFHFGKTTIIENSRPFLDSIGRMLLKAEYAERTLIVEGHTDAVGSASSNQRLSELRALAIKEYLVRRYAIDPYRLFPTGQGESMLSQPESPTDGVNRRVEFLPYQKK